MRALVFVFVFFVPCFLFPGLIQAAGAGDVIINEIAWMGTTVSYNDEWIELYNKGSSAINLDGWVLKAADGSPKIKLSGSFPANSFYLLERSKDYTGALNNKGEKLELYDNSGNLIDSVAASAGWPAGDNTTKQTMERIIAGGWQTSQNPGGTPGAENSPGQKKEEKEVGPETKTEYQLNKTDENGSRQLAIPFAFTTAAFSGIMILILKKYERPFTR